MKTLLRIVSTTVLPLLLTVLTAPASAQLGAIANDLVFTPITPCRIIDTRYIGTYPVGTRIAANSTRSFEVTSTANYSAQGGSATNCGGAGADGNYAAALINFTTVTPTGAGYITAYPNGATKPLASTLNYDGSDVKGNSAVIKLNQAGGLDLNVFSVSSTHLIADLLGYYATPKATKLDCVTSNSAETVVLPTTFAEVFTPQCNSDYEITGGGCYQTAGTGVYVSKGFYISSSTHPTNPNAQACRIYNSSTTSAISVKAEGRCCRIPGR